MVKHGSKIAWGYATGGDEGAGKAAARAAAQQVTHHFKDSGGTAGRLTRHLPKLVQAVTKGDYAEVARIALAAMAQQAEHASTQQSAGPEGHDYMATMAKRFAARTPRIFEEYMRGGGSAAGAAMLEELIEHTHDVAQLAPGQHQPGMVHLAHKFAKGAKMMSQLAGHKRRPRAAPAARSPARASPARAKSPAPGARAAAQAQKAQRAARAAVQAAAKAEAAAQQFHDVEQQQQPPPQYQQAWGRQQQQPPQPMHRWAARKAASWWGR